MATFYLDYEGGNDANDGLSFANRWKTFVNGATAARTNPGDTIRVMASPDPTSLGMNGVWTSAALQATKNPTIVTNTTPIELTVLAHGYSTGDTVVITGTNGNTAANGTWTITVTGGSTFTLNGSSGSGTYTSGATVRLRNNTRVALDASLTQNIECCGEFTNWIASTNVTTTLNTTTFKEHRASQSINISSLFTTGRACYKTLPSTLDLSSYQQVSFWIRQTGGSLTTANQVKLALCSDSTGFTIVHDIPIPPITTLNSWIPVTVNLGSALSSNINSVALYVNTDLGIQVFLIDNIIACKAPSNPDALTLTNLVGKNVTGEPWWPIQSINGSRVMLDAVEGTDLTTPGSAGNRGYLGPSGYGVETVTTYKRETISTFGHGLGTTFAPCNEGGVTYSGGWNRTDMSTQTGETWYDNRAILHTCYSSSNLSNAGNWSKFNAVRFSTGFSIAAQSGGTSFNGINNIALTACNIGLQITGAQITSATPFDNIYVYACNSAYIQGGGGNSANVGYNYVFTNSNFSSSTLGTTWNTDLVSIVSYNMQFLNCKFFNNTTAVTTFKSNNVIFDNNTLLGNDTPINHSDLANGTSYYFNSCTIDTPITMVRPCNWRFRNCTLNQFSGITSTAARAWADNVVCTNTTFTNATEIQNQQVGSNGSVFSHNHDNTADNHKVFTDGGLISSATDQRHTASGISWKLQPTTTVRSATYPLVLSLAKVAVAANSLVTIKAWMRRDNSGLTLRLVCKGGQIAGVSSDVVSAISTTNAWEEETITFTPTEAGVVEITAEAWGGTTLSGWVDDLTITQA